VGQGREKKPDVAKDARAREAALVSADAEEVLRRGRLVDHTLVSERRACIKGLILAGRTERGKLAPILATVWPLAENTIARDIVEVVKSIAEQEPDAVREALHQGLTEILAGAKDARKRIDDLLEQMTFGSPRDVKEASEAIKNGWDTTIRAWELLGKTHGVIQSSNAVQVAIKIDLGGDGGAVEATKAEVQDYVSRLSEAYQTCAVRRFGAGEAKLLLADVRVEMGARKS